jgi:hypothetical protein
MTRAAIVTFAVLSFVALPGCEKKDTVNPDDEASNAPAEEEDFAPEEEYDQQGSEEEEAAPGLSARSDCRSC